MGRITFGTEWSAFQLSALLLLVLLCRCQSGSRRSTAPTALDSTRVLTLAFSALMQSGSRDRMPSSYCLAVVSPLAQGDGDPTPAVLGALATPPAPILPFSRCSDLLQVNEVHDTALLILIWPPTQAHVESTVALAYKQLVGPFRGHGGECSFNKRSEVWTLTSCTSAPITSPDTIFSCIPESTFVLGSARIGETGAEAMARLGSALTVRRDTVETGDHMFLVTRYRYRDFVLTVSEASGRVAEIEALTPAVGTPLGIRLGMSRSVLEEALPRRALHMERNSSAVVYACASSHASALSLAFDLDGYVSQLVLEGYYLDD